ncbi:hypothetical protein C4D60_Mb01t08060 [Musa balbisiana]|uniref:Uncharacterized protein n=1 Tax=Musa balbisiana TaxID=52838 RepID=A0A4S8JKN4_MUSBA|nr:hypothetical protein C4D60_Mb01t08060 [Musa balbisiana]
MKKRPSPTTLDHVKFFILNSVVLLILEAMTLGISTILSCQMSDSYGNHTEEDDVEESAKK